MEIQRHTECAYYFKRHQPFCLVINEPEVSARTNNAIGKMPGPYIKEK